MSAFGNYLDAIKLADKLRAFDPLRDALRLAPFGRLADLDTDRPSSVMEISTFKFGAQK